MAKCSHHPSILSIQMYILFCLNAARCYKNISLRLRLHGAIYSWTFLLILSYCANLKTIRYESTSLNRIVADKLHRVIVALQFDLFQFNSCSQKIGTNYEQVLTSERKRIDFAVISNSKVDELPVPSSKRQLMIDPQNSIKNSQTLGHMTATRTENNVVFHLKTWYLIW